MEMPFLIADATIGVQEIAMTLFSAFAIGLVLWAYSTLQRHDKEIAVLQSNHENILAAIARVEEAVHEQTNTCRNVLSASGIQTGKWGH